MDLHERVECVEEHPFPSVESWAARWAPSPPATAPARLDPRELERQCRDLGLAVGHELFARLVQAYGDGRQSSRVGCACGGTRRWVGTRSRRVRDLMNREVTLARAYYFCDACGQGWLPLDEALGLTAAQVTPALYEVAVTCGSVAPPEEAAEVLAVVAGITLSPKSVERYTKAAGAATARAVTERAAAIHADVTSEPGAAAPAARPYNIQLDGGMLRMRDGTFREVKVACLFDSHDRAEVHPGRRVLLRKHYEAYLGGPDPLDAHNYAEARA